MKKISFLLIAFVTTIGFAQTEVAATPQIIFNVPLGETATADDITFSFEEVLEDSRCPKNVQCVWAGQARVKVIVSGNNISEETIELTVGKKDNDVILEMDGFAFKAIRLAPYPSAPDDKKGPYVLGILKKKL